ncbi:MAG: hypothetical protein IJW99_05470 [Clostridia bacterium]|nr:hypothetical protein [Clostridia bacterium]
MKARACVLGIDLGTSAVKGVLRSAEGETWKAKASYRGQAPRDWLDAMAAIIAELREKSGREIASVGFSSQVGTYVIDESEVISWRDDAGREELEQILSVIPQEEFVREIGMYHPNLISYPLPRLLHIQKHYGMGREVLMPKELLIRALTGETVTDVFSMRGIADLTRGRYAVGLTKKLGIETTLPPIKAPTDLAGYVTEEAAKKYGLTAGTPVYLGTSDFFAGLLGMGVREAGDGFDLSGTSEHVGYLSPSPRREGFVSGKYFFENCTYGVTRSSGPSCDFAIRNFGVDGLTLARVLEGTPPIFLPYLGGERAPVFDEAARGVYFGLGVDTDRDQMAYAALEGVVFSLYHIVESMGMPRLRRMICGGGSAANELMNRLRATVFDCEVLCVSDNDTSALGACMLAMTGSGLCGDLTEAIEACVSYRPPVLPMKEYRPALMRRFAIYRDLYGSLKENFRAFRDYERTKET